MDRAELFRALGVLAEPPGDAQQQLAALLGLPAPDGEAWTEAYVVQLVPHASIYLGDEGMLGGEAADRVAGFWRALRLPVPSDADHVTALLGLYAALVDAERDEPSGPRRLLRRQARIALLHEHLLSWLPVYTDAMAETGPAAYADWARLLADALTAETAEVGPPDQLPAALRDSAPVDAGDSLDLLLDGLLAPARSGVVVTRGHLAALARDTGLGLRLGDRRRMLRTLIEQEPTTALTALAAQARRWHLRHRARGAALGPVATHWVTRAATTASLLDAAATDLRDREAAFDTPSRQ